jgi:hypothetical protein
MTGGGTDAAFARRSGKATVVESFGLAGFGYHAHDDYIELDSIVPRLYFGDAVDDGNRQTLVARYFGNRSSRLPSLGNSYSAMLSCIASSV